MDDKMFKFNEVDLGGPTPNNQISVNEINATCESIEIPTFYKDGTFSQSVRYIGYKSERQEDTRSDYEKWKDEYYYNYYPTPSLIEVEVPVSKSVKKIFIPYTIENISKQAFKNLTGVEFEIAEKNYNYKVEDDKIINKHTLEVVWPYSE